MLRACRGEPVDRTPVWMMRQAGRYISAYREIRKTISFFDACRNPKLAAEITLQPLELFDIDGVVYFSDILVIQDEMGYRVDFDDSNTAAVGGGIITRNTLSDIKDAQANILDVNVEEIIAKLGYVYEGQKETLRLLDHRVPLIGFAGAPFTLLGYIIDGSHKGKEESEWFTRTIEWLNQHSELMIALLAKMADLIAAHLIAQQKAGCQLLQVFDSWAGHLAEDLYLKYALPAMARVVELVKEACPDTPVICFAKGKGAITQDIARNIKFDMISVDYDTDMVAAKECLELLVTTEGRAPIGLQGNLHPNVILQSKEVIEEKTKSMIESMGDQRRYIANLGHGCLPDFDPDHLRYFVDAVHKYSAEAIRKHSLSTLTI